MAAERKRSVDISEDLNLFHLRFTFKDKDVTDGENLAITVHADTSAVSPMVKARTLTAQGLKLFVRSQIASDLEADPEKREWKIVLTDDDFVHERAKTDPLTRAKSLGRKMSAEERAQLIEMLMSMEDAEASE